MGLIAEIRVNGRWERFGRLECDHIHPVSRGGSHDDDNLATACFRCNRSKRDKTLDEWRR